jgi:phenylpyruvate tautomerase PptA (4-oxalocrotonate tautomerase family)
VRDVEVEVTDRIQRISGTVTDAAGKIPESYVVVLFSEDPERWGGGTRYTMVARPGRNGEWAASTLPPGDYYAVALEYVEPGQWTDADFLESIRAQATRVTLAEGETQTLALRLTQM